MDENEKIIVMDENNNQIEANVINVLEIDGENYVLFSVDADDENANLYVNKIITDTNGEDSFISIEDDREREHIFSVVNEIISRLE